MLYVGTFVVVLGLGRLHATYAGHYSFTGSSRFGWSIAYGALLCVAAYAAGLPDLAGAGVGTLGRAMVATLCAAIGISLAQLALGSQLLPRFVVAWSMLFLGPAYTLCAFVTEDRGRAAHQTPRVVAVVDEEEAGDLRRQLHTRTERPAILAAHVAAADVRPRRVGGRPLIELATSAGATLVVLDRVAQADPTIVEQAAVLHGRGVRVRSLATFYEEWLGKLPMSDLERTGLMFDIGEVHRARYGRLKRLLDVGVGILGLVPLALATVVVMIVDPIANRGPIFYRQVRVGKGGREFTILKFRTMEPHGVGTAWTAQRDPRVTGVGRWLRRLHLDELPQMLNIVRGDLAIVGPRPEQPHYVAELTRKLPFYELRHLVRPGLTGWAQVKYGYGASESDAVEKLQYELYYLRHQSLSLDVRVIGRTLRAVAGSQGR